MRKYPYILIALLLAMVSCKKQVDHEAVRTSIIEMLSIQYDEDYILQSMQIRPSDRSPLLYEVINLEDEDTLLFSVDTKHSRAVDMLLDSHLMPFSLSYPISALLPDQEDARCAMYQLTDGCYSCTTDSTIRLISDSLFLLAGDTLYHMRCTKLYTLRNLRFELSFDSETLVRDWSSDSKYIRNLITDSGNEYNRLLASSAGRILAGDSLTNLELEKLIPNTEEKFHIYNLNEFLADPLYSLRAELYLTYDSVICNAAASTYELMDRYLNSYFFSDGAMAESMMDQMHKMDSINPLLFRQAACYTFDNTPAAYISDAIREYQNDWYDHIYE